MDLRISGDNPILLGYVDPDNPILRVWCDRCEKWHLHGAGPAKFGTRTHRIAHCTPIVAHGQGPYKSYWIAIARHYLNDKQASVVARVLKGRAQHRRTPLETLARKNPV